MNMRIRDRPRATLLGPGCAALILVCALGSAPALAHHSFAAEFDIGKPVEFRGRVLKVLLVNPHSWIHVEVTDKNGAKQTWMIEGGNPNELRRRGFTPDSVSIGTELQVSGYLARDGRNKVVGRTLKLANGVPVPFQPTELPRR